ncbi:hypothetical protein IEO21_06741 [Rhodonia placenta]|uniref:Velvet domain-containing protein n=1 Tax=Rhodonia placenta TaxID=104341 RepID=A0A8H7NZI1_9APHY|nr:hypothetical protein IEO21_06741 [Postia placenta]
MSQTFPQARRIASSPIGKPVTFVTGQFAGHTLRAELEELQKADLGRKYARKDRRPLDPPPVVQFRLFEVFNHGTPRETESEFDNYDEVTNLGILCHVDLFPITEDTDDADELSGGGTVQNTTPVSYIDSTSGQDFSMSAFPPSSTSLQMLSSPASPNMSQSYALSQGYPLSATLPSLPIPASRPSFDHTNSYPVQSASIGGEADTDIVAYYGDHPIRESSKCTHALAGTTFVQSASLEYNGKKVLMFVFSDLAVKIEGTFVLRYRVFNISSNAFVGSGIPILAECYGGPFKIYSTKEFPGLRASTDLTKHISFHGVRLNLRENERKRRKKNEIEAERRAAAAAADDNMSEADSSPAALSPVSCEPSTSAARTTGVRRSKRNKRQNRDKRKNSEDDSGDFDE